MSLLSWLFPPKPKTGTRHAAAPAHSTHAASASDGPRGERTQRREHLYLAVRDAMVRSGVLSSGYKFKVLSLDAEGRQFLVMLDIAPGYGADTTRQAEMEMHLIHTARSRFHVEVTAVYWRLNPALASPGGAASMATQAPAVAQAPVVAPPPAPAPVAAAPEAPTPPDEPGDPDFEPIAPDEVEAFKQALKKAAPTTKPATLAHPPIAEGNDPANGFADTLIVDQDERASRLGATQYGELR